MIILVWYNLSCDYKRGRDSELLRLVLKTLEIDCTVFSSIIETILHDNGHLVF